MSKKKNTSMLVLVLCLTMLTAIPCRAAYYSKTKVLSKVSDGTNTLKFSVMQGMVSTGNHIYSIKSKEINGVWHSAIYRTKIADGTTVRMTNITNPSEKLDYNTYIGKGCDVAEVWIDGILYLYVNDLYKNVTKLEVVGSTYKKVATYKLMLNGALKPLATIATISTTSTQVKFLFGHGNGFYVGTVGLKNNSGNIKITPAFNINRKGAKVNGTVVPAIENYTMQGVDYYHGKLYVTLWGRNTKDISKANYPNVSIILVYNGILAAMSQNGIPTLNSSNTAFRITSSLYEKYEIEGCGITKGIMYFNVNRTKIEGQPKENVICYFTDCIIQ